MLTMDYEEVKIVVSPYSGRLFVEFDDGSMLPLKMGKLGEVYIDYYPNRNREEGADNG